MEVGKVPNDVLNKIILNKIQNRREEVLVRPKIGEDCCAIDFGENVCVMSSDPITGTVNEIGRLAVHISCNDIASCGVEPIGLLVTILTPPETTEKDLEIIMDQICAETRILNVDILGGHTEITGAVNRCVIVTTAVGKVIKERMITTSGAEDGDDVILTKCAGLEGTAIIASERHEELVRAFGRDFIEKAKSFISSISVVKEGVIAGNFGVNSMHDVTEGGVLGAAWELAEASGKGIEIIKQNIPIAYETLRISEHFNIDPLKLISSGSMILSCKNGVELIKDLKSNGIEAAVIGKITKENKKVLVDGQKIMEIMQPGSDELYKVV